MLTKNISNTSKRYYLSIDELPLFNWIKCHDGKLEYLRKGKLGSIKNDLRIWVDIQDEYLKKFGLAESYKRLIQIQLLKAQKELDYIITNNRKILNEINIQETKLQNMIKSKGESIDVDDVLIYLSKFLGYKVTSKSMTVTEYFKSIDIYQKENKNGTTDKEE